MLNKLENRGSNSEALEKVKAAVSHLHTRYIADMQALDSTVSEISRLRDQQLYPRLVQLVDSCLLHQTFLDESDVPKVGMCFGILDDANQFYQNYAMRIGFVTKIMFTQRVTKDTEKHKSRVSPIEKINPKTNYNCPARISIRRGFWVISNVCLDHSHPCDPEMAKLLTRNREMSMHMCRVIERNDEAGVRPRHIKCWQVKRGISLR
ncbi:hypothetical protein Ahy_B08g092380 [Arachis hypogaea]|uniref:DUF632 domain-containing protein n=1 Tax=Arachis hypogaea TaxID=3818 RepID=A0A444Y3U3_ARAHY|nr:hypothetical protein Ahy_B08g092380 [Arachis hypogaea]